jgi:arylsulfatase A-like enzyme
VRTRDAPSKLPARFVAVLAALAVSACSRGPERLVCHRRLLEGHGEDAQTTRLPPGLSLVEGVGAKVRSMSVHGDARPALVLRPPSRVRCRVTFPKDGVLAFGVVARPIDAAIELTVAVDDGRSSTVVLRDAWQDRRPWTDYRLDLGRLGGRVGWLDVSARGPEGATLAIGGPLLLGRAVEAPRPNVIVYVVDCLRADHVGAYGYPRPTTPGIDSLASESVLFEKAYVCAPWTKPSVGCLFTSLPPRLHGAHSIEHPLSPTVLTLAEAFQAGGYVTAAWVTNPFLDKRVFGFARGFDRYVELAHRWAGQNVGNVPADAAELRSVIPWLEENRSSRFFLYLHSLDLHAPYRARAPFDRVFVREDVTDPMQRDIDRYDTELAYNDREIAHLLGELRRLGLLESTLFVLTADHGEEFMEHGFTRHGRSLYDALLHVPVIVRLPGASRAGERIAGAVSNLDLAPTLLDYAGLPVPASFEGHSQRPAIEAGRTLEERHLFAEHIGPRELLFAVRDGRHKLIERLVPDPGTELFDYVADPLETRNLAEARPAETERLRARLLPIIRSEMHGHHLAVGPTQRPRSIRLRAETQGEVEDVLRLVVRTGDRLEISPDRQTVELTAEIGEHGRHLVLHTNPPDAAIRVHLEGDGGAAASAPLVGGAESGRTVQGVWLGIPELSVPASRIGGLFEDLTDRWRVYYVPPDDRGEIVEMDPRLRQELEALGYLEPR